MWYAIQTITGKEEETLDTIRRVSDSEICENCFLLKREAVWRIHGGYRIHTERLFPGYIFVCTCRPEVLYQQLRQVPQYTRLLGKEEQEFYPVSQEEEIFLRELINGDPDNTVRLSTVEVDGKGNITASKRPLQKYLDCVVKKRIRLRYVVIQVQLFGREREILLGIRLEGDHSIERERQ